MILYYSITVALIVFFIHSLFWEGMILSFIAETLFEIPTFIKKPLFECVICMTPWYGLVIYFFCARLSAWDGSVFSVVITLLVASGINAVLSQFIEDGYDEQE